MFLGRTKSDVLRGAILLIARNAEEIKGIEQATPSSLVKSDLGE
jgi:hypothetical protein